MGTGTATSRASQPPTRCLSGHANGHISANYKLLTHCRLPDQTAKSTSEIAVQPRGFMHIFEQLSIGMQLCRQDRQAEALMESILCHAAA